MPKYTQTFAESIYKKASSHLVTQFKTRNPGFNRTQILEKIKEIDEYVRADESFLFLINLLEQKAEFESAYLVRLINTFLTEEMLTLFYPHTEQEAPKSGRNIAELYTQMTNFIEVNTQVTDRRKQDDSDQFLRRMDALARIFSLHISYSACVAVAIHNGQLIVAANVGIRTSAEEIDAALVNKVNALRKLVNLCQATTRAEIDKFCRQPGIIETFASALGIGVNPEIFYLSLAKVLHVLKSNDYPYGDEFKKAFASDEPIVVLTPIKDEKGLHINAHVHSTYIDLESHIPLPAGVNIHTQQKDLHAEQMIYQYFYRRIIKNNFQGPTRIGISKLPCATCHEVLDKDPNFLVRGTHHNQYAGTLNIVTGKRVTQNSNNYGLTNAISSGLFSPGTLGMEAEANEEPEVKEIDLLDVLHLSEKAEVDGFHFLMDEEINLSEKDFTLIPKETGWESIRKEISDLLTFLQLQEEYGIFRHIVKLQLKLEQVMESLDPENLEESAKQCEEAFIVAKWETNQVNAWKESSRTLNFFGTNDSLQPFWNSIESKLNLFLAELTNKDEMQISYHSIVEGPNGTLGLS